MAGFAYCNADREEFLFDSRHDLIETDNPQQMLTSQVRLLLWAPWQPGQPFAHATFMLNALLNEAQGRPTWDLSGFVITNVLIHGLNACLVFFLIRTLLSRIEPGRIPSVWIPLAVAVLFAVHPIHASSVLYIMQRRGMLVTAFHLLALLCFLRARRSPDGTSEAADDGRAALRTLSVWPWSRWLCALGVPFFYWLSFKSKTIGLPLPVGILAIEFCLRAPDRAALRRYARWLVPGLLVASAWMCLFAFNRGYFDPYRWAHRIWSYDGSVTWGVWEHFLTESRAFVHYWKLLWLPLPRWSCLDHDFAVSWSIWDHGAIVAILFHVVLVIVAVIAALRSRPLVAFGIFWFYIGLIPYIIYPQSELLVEYKTYVSSIGAALVLAEGMRAVRGRVSLVLQAAIVTTVSCALLATTLHRNSIYRNSKTVFADAIRKSPNKPRVQASFGYAIFREGRVAESVSYFEAAVRLAPAYPAGRAHLALAYAMLGRNEEAIAQYREGLRLAPDRADLRNGLANAFVRTHRLDAAIEQYRKAVALRSDLPEYHVNLAGALLRAGRALDAIAPLREALRISPDFADAHERLAIALAAQDNSTEALSHLRQAEKLGQSSAWAWTQLAALLLREQREVEAVEALQRVVRLDPANVTQRYTLGVLLRKQGQLADAAAVFGDVLKNDPSHTGARKQLESLAMEPSRPGSNDGASLRDD
ncbi:MAG: tetratricopeptide repeat protein [Phycisphaerae bacterium]|nr:tetratricopeptide repeat protein [Phycisphaerae bacterium]